MFKQTYETLLYTNYTQRPLK